MEFESSLNLAERMGINVRTVQLWAKNGKLPGAYKLGRDWMIPITVGEYLKTSPELANMCDPLPLMNSAFEEGEAKKFIETIEDKQIHRIALGEYYYFTGQVQKACEAIESYLRDCDGKDNASAWIVYSFSCMALGKTRLAKVVAECVAKMVHTAIDADIPAIFKATCVFLAKTSRVIITNQDIEDVPLKDYIKYLTGGFRAFSCFTLSQEACFKGQFGRASGIAEMGIALMDDEYPLAKIHLEIASAMAHLGLKEVSKASEHLLRAWNLAEKDGFYQPFVEHFTSIQHLLLDCIDEHHHDKYKKISEAAAVFSSSRRRLARHDDYDEISKPLTSKELVAVVLMNADASNAEIAQALDISVTAVKEMIPGLLMKLGVNNKKEMLKFFER